MQGRTDWRQAGTCHAELAIVALPVVTGAMLLAMNTRIEPHQPPEVEPFEVGPFLAAQLAIGVAACGLIVRGIRLAPPIAALIALSARASCEPQEYVEPGTSRTWPAVIVGQVGVAIILYRTSSEATRRMWQEYWRSE